MTNDEPKPNRKSELGDDEGQKGRNGAPSEQNQKKIVKDDDSLRIIIINFDFSLRILK